MALNSAIVVAGTDATAAQYNNLREDVLLHAGDTLVDSSVSANTVTVAIPAQITALENGLILKIEVKTTNTGATNLSLTGGIADTVDLKHQNGAELSNGDIQAGQYIYCIYDDTNDRFEIISKTYLEKTLYKGIAGETVTAGQPLYFKASDSKLWKLTTAANGEAAQAFAGWCVVGGNANDTIVYCYEYTNNQSGLTAGSPVFGSDTAGNVAHTRGTVTKQLGIAISTTEVETKEGYVASGTLTNVPIDTTTVQTVNCGFSPDLLILTGNAQAWANETSDTPDDSASTNVFQMNIAGAFANGMVNGLTGANPGLISSMSETGAVGIAYTPLTISSLTLTTSAARGGVTQKASFVVAVTATGFTFTPDTTKTAGTITNRAGTIENLRWIAYKY